MTTTTATAAEPANSAAKPASKSAAVIKLLSRARGATVVEMQASTNWQPHSVRAYLSGLRKTGRALAKEERKSGETSYRLRPAMAAGKVTAAPVAKSDLALTAVATPANADIETTA